MTRCPNCGDTRLSFNLRPFGRYDEGELFACAGCEAEGESIELIDEDDLEMEKS